MSTTITMPQTHDPNFAGSTTAFTVTIENNPSGIFLDVQQPPDAEISGVFSGETIDALIAALQAARS